MSGATAPNWETGHWLTGRLGAAPLDALVAAILADCGVDGVDVSGAASMASTAIVVDRPMSPRAMIEPLALAYAFDADEDGGIAALPPARRCAGRRTRRRRPGRCRTTAPPLRLTRAQETELPREVSLGFTDVGADYRRSAVDVAPAGRRRARAFAAPTLRW